VLILWWERLLGIVIAGAAVTSIALHDAGNLPDWLSITAIVIGLAAAMSALSKRVLDRNKKQASSTTEL
jgi:multisubunit Na+/H+ antiporter MnhC subunit